MKRLLFFLFFIGFTITGFSQVTVQGTVYDTLGNPVTGGMVFIHYLTDTPAVNAYVVNGSYSAVIRPSAYSTDSLIVSFTDGCYTEYTDTVAYNTGMTSVTFNPLTIACPPPIEITIRGRVLDTLGLPVPNVMVRYFAYPDMGYDMAGMNGDYELNLNLASPDDSVIILQAMDKCSDLYSDTVVVHYGPPIIHDLIVGCGIGKRLHIEGVVRDTQNNPIPQDGISVSIKSFASSKVYFANTDYYGHYAMDLPVPSTLDSFYVSVVADCGGAMETPHTVVYYDGGSYNLNADVIMPFSGCNPVSSIDVNGYVGLSSGGDAANIEVSGYMGTSPDHIVTAHTGQYGLYDLLLPVPQQNTDSVFLTFKDGCGNIYQDTLLYTFGNSSLSKDTVVQCNGPALPEYITFKGFVKGKNGKPAKGITVSVEYYQPNKPMFDGPPSTETNEFGYYELKLYNPPADPAPVKVFLQDYGDNVYSKIVEYDAQNFVYDSVDFVVQNPDPIEYVWNGVVRDTSGHPLPGVKVKGMNLRDTTEYIIATTDMQGYYKLVVQDAIFTDLIGIKLIDGCGNVLLDTVPFDQNVHHYTNDYVMGCPGPKPDTVVSFVGVIKDNQNRLVSDQLVQVMMIDTTEGDTMQIATVSDAEGFYSVSLPVPERPSSIYWTVEDKCGNVYTDSAVFNFDNYLYTKDFSVQCPPSLTPMKPNLMLGFKPDWQNFNTFKFFAMPKNISIDKIDYFVWYLTFDTIATKKPELVYTFPAMDTCLQVRAKVVMTNGMSMLSNPVDLCIENMFNSIGADCYADFMVTRVKGTPNLYGFVPFVQRKADLTPVRATWNFGDGSSLTITPPDTVDKPVGHQYVNAGRYNVTYTVTFADTLQNECSATWSNPVWVGHDVWYPDSCAAVFYVELDSTNARQVHFEDISYPGDSSSIEYYYWDFGDGQMSTVPSPDHLYSSSDTFTVTMSIITSSGCSDEMQMQLPIVQGIKPMMFFPDTIPSSKKSFKGYGVKFRNISKTSTDKYKWDFGDAVKETVITPYDTITHYYADTGYYDVVMQDYYTGAGIKIRIHLVSATEVNIVSTTLIPAGQAAGVEQVYNFDKLTVYPVPATDVINVVLPENVAQVRMEILNVQGQVVKTIYAANTDRIRLDVSSLAPGTYFIRTIRDRNIGLAKFVKH